MISNRSEVLVLDLEATCWDTPEARENNVSEIIEIGVCVLDMKSGNISRPKGILVKPTASKVSEFCTRLTTITPDLLDKEGVTLRRAVDELIDAYGSPNRIIAAYGAYDGRFLKESCVKEGIRNPLSREYLNVSMLSSMKFKTGRKLGLAKSLQLAGLPFEGTHHRGVDDAVMTAKLLYSILN